MDGQRFGQKAAGKLGQRLLIAHARTVRYFLFYF